MALLSWANSLNPPLPLLSFPPTPPDHYQFQDDHSHIASKDLDSAKEDAARTMQTSDYPENLKLGQQDGYDVDYDTEKRNNEQGLHGGTKIGKLLAITKHLSAFICVTVSTLIKVHSLKWLAVYRHEYSTGYQGDLIGRRGHGRLQPSHHTCAA